MLNKKLLLLIGITIASISCKRVGNVQPIPTKPIEPINIALDYIVFDDCYSFKPADKDNNITKLKFYYNQDKSISKVDWNSNDLGKFAEPTHIYYENREYNPDQKLSKVYTENMPGNIKTTKNEYFYTNDGQLSKIIAPDPYNNALTNEFTIKERTGEKILKAELKYNSNGQVWQYQYTYNKLGNLIELNFFNIATPASFVNYKVEYDTNPNPLYKLMESEMGGFHGIVYELFYFSKNNPTNITYNTSQCTPCSDIHFKYVYKYDKIGRPVNCVMQYTGGSQLYEKVDYTYLNN